MTAGPACRCCHGTGSVRTKGGVDACPDCAHRAELAWRALDQQRRTGMWSEHVNKAGRGSDPTALTIGVVRGRLELVAGRGVLVQLPWYRGGQPVTVMLGAGSNAGRMMIVRGDTHKLLTLAVPHSLDKLPPVLLRMDLLAHIRPGEEHEPEAAAFSVSRGVLEVTLPEWAAPPVPMRAPATPFGGGFSFHQDRGAAGGRA